MYSKAYSDRRYAVGGNEDISLPPRYGGVRFVKEKRSDGREGILERNAVPMAEKAVSEPDAKKIETVGETGEAMVGERFTPPVADTGEKTVCDTTGSAVGAVSVRKTKDPLSEILKNVGEDDILIIAIILIIAAEKGENGRGAIMLLALLLCFR